MAEDKFQILKSKYLERLRLKEREVAELKEKVRLIQELEAEANAQSVNGVEVANGKYKELGLTESIIDAIRVLALSDWVNASAVGKHLLSQGFQPKGKNFPISVGLTLKRLAKGKRIQTKSEAGSRLFMATPQ